MQYHLNGFRAGDPHTKAESAGLRLQPKDNVDVLIVGCGPAGLTLAAQLSAFDDISTRIVEQKEGPLQLGQADGLACRTLEMFEAFGFSERVIREAYNVVETVFWSPDKDRSEHIVRSGRVQDVEDDLSEFPHLILNQARVHDRYLELMQQSPRRLTPDYGCSFVGLKSSASGVDVTLQNKAGQTEQVNARYVVGCDGARSAVRQAIGLQLKGDSANQAWGVMDVLLVTDFPDIRFKTVVRSSREGNVLVIPREGGYLVRLYIELDKLAPGERVASRNIEAEHLVAAAQRIFHPYTLDVKEMVWWSVYEIGQRLCDQFDDALTPADAPRVFIAGDACHTHSPKAGQGMNVSMADTFNLGWKLAAVVRGNSAPEILHSYSVERQQIAHDLIEFDRHWAARFSEATRKAEVGTSATQSLDAAEFQRYFSEHGRYTAGLSVKYSPSILVADAKFQSLATGLTVGMRFHSSLVTRMADALPMQLAHTIKADGRWRLMVFANAEDPTLQHSALWQLCNYLSSQPDSPMLRYQRTGDDPDALIDLRVVIQQSHRDLNITDLHSCLLPVKGKLGLRDRNKVFSAEVRHEQNFFDKRGVSRDGCTVVVRPDQYVADVMPLDATDRLSAFFRQILLTA